MGSTVRRTATPVQNILQIILELANVNWKIDIIETCGSVESKEISRKHREDDDAQRGGIRKPMVIKST